MNVDEILEKALSSNGGYLDPTDLYGMVGDIESNEILVLKLSDFLLDNSRNFLLGTEGTLGLLGAYINEQFAREAVITFREESTLQGAGLIVSPNWYVLLANPVNNTLNSFPLTEYYVRFFTLFQYKAKPVREMLVMNIFSNQDSADEFADFIRLYIKDSKGNIIRK
jgi:hypothetical protein